MSPEAVDRNAMKDHVTMGAKPMKVERVSSQEDGTSEQFELSWHYGPTTCCLGLPPPSSRKRRRSQSL